MLGLAAVSLVLTAVDHFSGLLEEVRAGLSVVATPVVMVADLPSRSARGIGDVLSSRDSMRSRISELESELLMLRARTEKMAALTSENNRLRDLLGSAAKLQDNVIVAELVGVDPDPDRHEVIIDKGTRDGVFVGQPLLDAQGLMGQVIATSRYNARVLLISDHTHSVPVQVARSNLRLIAQGTGATNRLRLMHVQNTADIRVGDLLISSGLGGRFPVGYPVGVVERVEHKSDRPFAIVEAMPSALLDRSRHVLLVFTEERRLAGRRGEGSDGSGG
ncbi:MAG: rod shape-determining protein MreC [Proteobacteria bacterium]|nr:rod shape-determining protein MreC [Pseudomonadota bacterium]